MSSCAVFAASSASGRLTREDSQPATSSVTSSVTSTATPNQRSTDRSTSRNPASGADTTRRASSTRALSSDSSIYGSGSSLTATSRAVASTPGSAVSPGRTSVTLVALSPPPSRARNAESTAMPPIRMNRRSPIASESSRASATNGPSAVRARTRAMPLGAVGSSAGRPGSDRSNSLRKCPELTMRPESSWIWSRSSPASRIAEPA